MDKLSILALLFYPVLCHFMPSLSGAEEHMDTVTCSQRLVCSADTLGEMANCVAIYIFLGKVF